MGDVQIKDLSELPDFSMLDCDHAGLPKNWCFSQGVNGLEPSQWAIKYVHEDLTTDLYPLPPIVSVLIRWSRNHERQDMQSQFRHLLGL